MIMRLLTLDEQREILRCLSRAHFWADMMVIDCICYGGDVRKYGDQKEYAAMVIGAFPKDIREAFIAEQNKVRADELRKKADAIERGENIEA